MSINRICSICRRTYKLDTLFCTHCSRPLSRLKVRVKTPTSGWKTLQTRDLQTAQDFQEAAFRSSRSESHRTGKRERQQRAEGTPNKIQTPSPAPGGSPSLATVFDLYITQASRHKRSWRSDVGRMENYLLALAPLPLDSITPELIQKTLDGIQPHKKFKNRTKSLSAATRRQASALLKILFNFAIRRRLWAGQSPMKFVDPIAVHNERHRFFSQEEIQQLFRSIEADSNPVAGLMIKFLLLTGARRGMVLKLESQDFNAEHSTVIFRHTKNGRVQVVPVSPQAVEVLQKAAALREPGEVRFFPFKAIHHFTVCWQRIRQRSGLKDCRLHDCRHYAASTMVSNGVSLYTAGRILGHRSLSMTERYAHLQKGVLQQAVDLLGQVLQKAEQQPSGE